MENQTNTKQYSDDQRSIDTLIEAVTNPPPEPTPREKGYEKAFKESSEYREVFEKCGNIRGLVVCVDDEVILYVGRYWFNGVVKNISKLGVVIINQHHESAIALGKISFVTVLKRGKWYHMYCQIKGC